LTQSINQCACAGDVAQKESGKEIFAPLAEDDDMTRLFAVIDRKETGIKRFMVLAFVEGAEPWMCSGNEVAEGNKKSWSQCANAKDPIKRLALELAHRHDVADLM